MKSVLLTFLLTINCIHALHIYETFPNPLGRESYFEKMIVDRKNTGRVYVGGVSRVNELTPELSMRTSFTHTGDGTTTHTKALAFDDKYQRLIVCTSTGKCEVRAVV
jgi:hypothetical protein